ncbi:MAG: hypothetical protein IRZ08_02545 [Frankia sp.]|nr:hypothetical protein [Frankia sp.]
MDVSVDDERASALAVMSQGEQHSLALSLFLPRARTADSPFGFLLIDDPVQSTDPAKVNGLAQVLHDLGRDRQVLVFSHGTRLRRAFASQGLSVTVFEVERGPSSRVTVRRAKDPVEQALDDARAIALTEDLPEEARSHVLPGLCRQALENAFIEAAWIRRHRDNLPEHELLTAIASSDRLVPLAALALFGDATRSKADVEVELARLGRGWTDVQLVRDCQSGAHAAGTSIGDPRRFVDRVANLAEIVRRPQAVSA